VRVRAARPGGAVAAGGTAVAEDPLDVRGDGGVDRRPGLYVHVPFCSRVCPYCDFSVVRERHPLRAGFVDAVLREAEGWRSRRGPAPLGGAFGTVYFGGGTPSALADKELAALVEGLGRRLNLAGDAVWSMEANPEDVSRERLETWAGLGFSHLSLGLQSLDDRALSFLGRWHTAREGIRACEAAVASSVANVSFDLIYGFDRLGEDGWQRVLDRATALGPDHLSCYELTVHRGTAFGRLRDRGDLRLPGEDHRGDLFVATVERLAVSGYRLYEVSNFATRDDARSPHNRKYWSGIPYLGLGPSAHSFDGVRRWWNHRLLREWGARIARGGDPVAGAEDLTSEQRRLEYLLTRLRTVEGFDLADYRQFFGRDFGELRPEALEHLQEQGLLRCTDRRISPTVRGLAVADALVLELVG